MYIFYIFFTFYANLHADINKKTVLLIQKKKKVKIALEKIISKISDDLDLLSESEEGLIALTELVELLKAKSLKLNYDDGLKLIQQSKFHEGKKVFANLISLEDEKILQSYYWLSFCLFFSEEYEKSISSFYYFLNKLEKNTDNNAELLTMKKSSYKYLFFCFLKMKRLQDAKAIFLLIKEKYEEEESEFLSKYESYF